MVLGLESAGGDFEAKVLEDIRASSGATLINGELYFGSVDADPEHHEAVLGYLKAHQKEYGGLSPIELRPHVDISNDATILLNPTEEQAIALGKAIDRAYTSTMEGIPLRYIINVSIGGLMRVIDDSCLC